MLFKRVIKQCENGQLMLMTLIAFMVLSVLGTAIVGVAAMERKISHAGVEALQAQQAADAGVEWAIEEIWNMGLLDNINQQLNLGTGISSTIEVTERTLSQIDIGNGNNNGNHGNGNNGNGNGNNGNNGNGNNGNGNGNGNNGNGNGNDSNLLNECTYRFISTGVYQGVTRKVEVEVVYTYSEIFPSSYDSVEIRSYKIVT